MSVFGEITLAGMHIIESPYALKETTERLFPQSRHRSARLRKKLIKRFGGEFRKEPAAFDVGGTLVVHPEIAALLRQKIAETQSRIEERAFMFGAGPIFRMPMFSSPLVGPIFA